MARIKDCLIVAAGKGTRLKGLGDSKPMVNLGGKPLIEHAMLAAARGGVENFVIVTGYQANLLQTFVHSLKKKYNWKIRTVFNADYERANGLSVLMGAPYLKDEFFLAMCDHVVDPALYHSLSRYDLPEGAIGLGVDLDLENPNVDIDDVTRVRIDREHCIHAIGKHIEKYNAYDCGIFRAGPSLFAAIRQSEKETGDCSISGGMQILAAEGKARGIDIGTANWLDVDSMDMHRLADIWVRENGLGRRRAANASASMDTQRKVVAVGHRGTKKFAPENTIAAHEAAFALGARCIEFDVRCTKDGHFILMHDGRVNRTTNGTGRVKDMTLAQIRKLDAGSWKGEQFAGEPVPTLREALRNVNSRFVVDIDFKGGPDNSAELLDQVLTEEGYGHGKLVTIFARWHHFRMLQSLCPKYALRPHYISARTTRKLANEFPLEIMGLRRLSFSFRAARAVRDNNMHLFCNVMGWADGRRGYRDSLKAGAMFIQTDHLDKLVPFLEERGLLETRVLGRDYQVGDGSGEAV